MHFKRGPVDHGCETLNSVSSIRRQAGAEYLLDSGSQSNHVSKTKETVA